MEPNDQGGSHVSAQFTVPEDAFVCHVPQAALADDERYAAVLVVLYLAFLTAALVVEISG